MFIPEGPIQSEKEDFLGRTHFSQKLGESLISWKKEESLIIALYGKWGSGKSSIINLAKEYITYTSKEKPTIIEFNPWLFSDLHNLSGHFFNEIAKELEIRNESERDNNIAGKLKLYAKLLDLGLQQSAFRSLASKIILSLGLLGISASNVLQWLNISSDTTKNILFVAGFIFIIFEIFRESLYKLSSFFEQKAKLKEKSIISLKQEIREEILKRKNKLIIIIDDIDRLNQSEIRQIFRLIRVNADFPNTIYFLAFERRIIELNLQEQPGISGKDYLDKIVQVSFDVPFTKQDKISRYLFQELDRILDTLPKSAKNYFEKDDPYWINIYHSGFKNLFRNIRDVKRYASSLEFNISQMHRGEILEVNPIDFIAIEAIRVFVPEFHEFMKSRKELFTSTERESTRTGESPRKKELQEILDTLSNDFKDLKNSLLELIKTLFPQIEGVYEYGYSSYGHEWQSRWSKELRVCASSNFDAYFTFIPGGDEEGLSQFEIEIILGSIDNSDDFEKVLRDYMQKNKIRVVLDRIQDYTSDDSKIPAKYFYNIILALFNISDELPKGKKGMLDFGADMDVLRIVYQLLKREPDKEKNYFVLKEAISKSKGLYGPIQQILWESPKENEKRNENEFIVPEGKIKELQNLCVDKINEFGKNDKLLTNDKLPYILYRWKGWGSENEWKQFIKQTLVDDKNTLLLLEKFIVETRSQTMTDYGIRIIDKFNYKSLRDFIDVEHIKLRLDKMKHDNGQLYREKSKIVDLFLSQLDEANRDPDLF